jgi:hypothetical protein
MPCATNLVCAAERRVPPGSRGSAAHLIDDHVQADVRPGERDGSLFFTARSRSEAGVLSDTA